MSNGYLKIWLGLCMTLFLGIGYSQKNPLPKQRHLVYSNLNTVDLISHFHCSNIRIIDAKLGLFEVELPTEFPKSFQWKSNSNFAIFQSRKSTVLPVNRTKLPNDPNFSSQYFLGKIKATRVWDYTTGGLNRNGDTIVVAFIDEGVDTSHLDLIPNLWINHAEIKWNGIDEDGNGYTDDYYGWNGGDSNGRVVDFISGAPHGTLVGGTIGARGNNAVGVSGVNWNVKIMPCVFWAKNRIETENGIYRSIGYVLSQKKLYKTSNKSKGANIVAVNMSFGYDGYKVDDFPIFCALIDSAYKLGMTVTIAATNSNVNINQAGDIPSLCPSVGSIVVNGINQADEFNNSGYSATDVDIAAPADNIFGTESNKVLGGTYGAKGGNSFAAPQVAGAIGLLHATVCKKFLQLYDTLPDSAVRLMKSWIMDGVDKNVNLNLKNKSQGQLNMYNAFLKMDTWCRARDTGYNQSKSYLKKSFRVFPNPLKTGEVLHFFGLPNTQPILLKWISMDGKICVQTTLSNFRQISVPSNLKPGYYYLELNIENQITRTPIIVSE